MRRAWFCARSFLLQKASSQGAKKPLRTLSLRSRNATTCQFSGIAPGTYAVSVFHDENSNGKLDINFIGIPREGVGASNNARGHFEPPGFDPAAFQFPRGRVDLKITFTYL
jgi:uncharacterized protein (DUF2141 family)